MKSHAFAVVLLLALGCSPTPATPETANRLSTANADDWKGNLGQVKRWVDSLSGASVDQVTRMMNGGEPTRSSWQHEDQGGELLTYQLAEYDIDFYFSENAVVLVSIDLSPE